MTTDDTTVAELARAFVEADNADRAAGTDRLDDDVHALERARSLALEALAAAIPCPRCGATGGCTGKVAHTVALWSLDHELPLHRARITLINRAANAAGAVCSPVMG